jgi:hypothetical protein
LRGSEFSDGCIKGSFSPSFKAATAFVALDDVAEWLGFQNRHYYNAACRNNPDRVRQLLAEAK